MKTIAAILLLTMFNGCKKCQTCTTLTVITVAPPLEGYPVKRTSFVDLCGSELKNMDKSDQRNTYYIEGRSYTHTTKIECK